VEFLLIIYRLGVLIAVCLVLAVLAM